MSNPSLKNPANLIATWFGCGLITPAPGTWGSLGALPFAIIMFHFGGLYALILATLILTPIGFWATAKYEESSGIHDNKQIVIDEVIGQWIALLPVFYFLGMNWLYIAIAFALFRLFDITKPWPISHFDKNVQGATGVMVDDIMAGIFAAILITGGIYAGFS
ncbi:MAG: phosphatidylglycerophosphatase A [Alphaproteobacteria bacterium]|nr:phosphatidylglycerophosphatase A [Alphaproteobacteria bacterium]